MTSEPSPDKQKEPINMMPTDEQREQQKTRKKKKRWRWNTGTAVGHTAVSECVIHCLCCPRRRERGGLGARHLQEGFLRMRF